MGTALIADVTRSKMSDMERLRLDAIGRLVRTHELLQAIADAEQLVADLPDSPIARTALGDVKFLAKDYPGAEREYLEVQRLRPTDRVACFMLGRCQTERWSNTEAVASYLRCLRLVHTPTEPGTAAGVWSRIHEANVIHEYRGLLESPVSEPVLIRRHLADALIKSDRFDDVLECLRPAMALIPADWPMHYQCGTAMYLAGRFQEAARHFEEVIELSPGDFRAAFFAASAHLQNGNVDRALHLSRRGLLPHLPNVEAFTGPMAAPRKRDTVVALPWNLRAYLFSGLFHPLLLALLNAPLRKHRLEFCGEPDAKAVPDDQILAALEGFKTSLEYLRTTCTEASAGHIFAFLESRHLLSQVLTSRETRFAIPHTAPYSMLDHPWLLHIETPTTIFSPFVSYGMTKGFDFESSPYFHIVRRYLESPSCLGVFSHLKSTCEVLPRLFKSDVITKKVHYMPLGAPEGDRPTKAQFERKCATALAGKKPRRILFTSSFNQSDWSFFSRGGLYVLNSFLDLADEFDDIELVLRSTIPVGLKRQWADAIIAHPRIEVLHRKLSNRAIADLYAGSEIMAFPSYTLHCQSLFRAMYSGAICVISDAPDYTEFIVDRKTAVIARRTPGAAYERDDIGMTREHYPEMRMFDADFGKEVTAAFRYVLEDRARADRIRRRARQTIVQRYPRSRMYDAFNRILMRADARSRAIAPR